MSTTPNTLLTRPAAAQFLTEQGYPTTCSTLATKATRGGGPEYECFGRRPLYRPVKLLEWGEGTTTLTQCWSDVAKGSLRTGKKVKAGVTVLEIVIDGGFKKKNDKDDWLKIAQPGEGMTPTPDKWGEVAMGRIKSVEQEGGKQVVYIELKNAIKIGK